jgi:hypothetical protein
MTTPRVGFTVAVVLLNGVSYAAVGVLLLLSPEWFFNNIGNFPPFNRHYAGDLGSFQLALGAVLLFALRRADWRGGLLGVAAVGGTIHALNHAVDAARGTGGWDQTLALFILAAVTLVAFMQVLGQGTPMSRTSRRLRPDYVNGP